MIKNLRCEALSTVPGTDHRGDYRRIDEERDS